MASLFRCYKNIKIKRLFLSVLILFFFLTASSQNQDSRNGKTLPASGSIRVLVIFAEINYDVHPQTDPVKARSVLWPVGSLPVWKDSLFDPYPASSYIGHLSLFYKESSFGQLAVLGDYIPKLITINESEVKHISSYFATSQILNKLNQEGQKLSAHGLKPPDFDNWTINGYGLPKSSPSQDNPSKFDHIMFIFRNIHDIGDGAGRASPGTPGKLWGLESDSYSIFRTSSGIPFDIARHEFGHLILGDNNFHSGGGQHALGGANYFICTQGGWSLLGGANSSLQTCNGWDRDRLGWIGPGKELTISARDLKGNEISTDLTMNDVLVDLILGDFVTTGDVVRIQLPVAEEQGFKQWLWIENHQTYKRNSSPFDRFHFEKEPCAGKASPGLYMYLQVDKELKQGRNIYGGYADYLRFIPATGFYDLRLTGDTIQNNCVNSNKYAAFQRNTRFQNPFTGNSTLEFPVIDTDKDGHISSREAYVPAIERIGLDTLKNLPYLGSASDAFNFRTQHKISIGTNPSTANMLTLVSDDQEMKGLPNNRKIQLNGLSVEITEEREDGSIHLRIRTTDYKVEQDVRWCADTILVPELDGGPFMIKSGYTVTLDQGLTPTRLDHPVTFQGEKLFAGPTHLLLEKGARLLLEAKAKLRVENGSHLVLSEASEIILEKGAELEVTNTCTLTFYKQSKIIVKDGGRLILRKNSLGNIDKENIVAEKGAVIKIKRKM